MKKKVGAGIGMKKRADTNLTGKTGSNARTATSKNAPNSKLGPKQGATSKGTGVGKKGR